MAKRFTVPATAVQATQTAQVTDAAGSGSAVANGKGKKKVKRTKPLTDADLTEANGITEAIRKGINNGELEATWATVDASDKAKGVAKAGFIWYIRLRALTGEGMMLATNGKMDLQETDSEKLAAMTPADRAFAEQKGIIDHFNYGLDLDRRRQNRGKLTQSLEGPGKLIKRVVVGMLAEGEYTHDEIRAKITRNKKFLEQISAEEIAKIVNVELQANA
jgi:hypothetical protein